MDRQTDRLGSSYLHSESSLSSLCFGTKKKNTQTKIGYRWNSKTSSSCASSALLDKLEPKPFFCLPKFVYFFLVFFFLFLLTLLLFNLSFVQTFITSCRFVLHYFDGANEAHSNFRIVIFFRNFIFGYFDIVNKSQPCQRHPVMFFFLFSLFGH